MTSVDPAVRWCLPDWRNSKAYPEPGELSPLGWRIEFLRRNPEYREDWQRTDLTSHNARAAAVCARWALPRAWPPTASPLDLVRRARIRNLIDANADATLPLSLLTYTGGSPAAPAGARTAGGPVFSGGSKLVRCLGWILGVPRPAAADPQHRREADWSRYLQSLDAIETGASLTELRDVLITPRSDNRGSAGDRDRQARRLLAEARRLAAVMAQDRTAG